MIRLPESVTRSYADSIAGCTPEEFVVLMDEYVALVKAANRRVRMKLMVKTSKLSNAVNVLTDYATRIVAEDDRSGTGEWVVDFDLPVGSSDVDREEMRSRIKAVGAELMD